MRPVSTLVAFLTACGGTHAPGPGMPDDPAGPASSSTLADEDRYVPSYDKSALEKALIAERGAEATQERAVGELEGAEGTDDRLRVARADLAVRRSFIAQLEACQADGRTCPPRLDDPPWAFDPDPDRPAAPPIDAPLHFDLAGWRAIADELFGRGCACRTIACVDSVGVAIDQLEARTPGAIQGDETAALAITRARGCLFRLRGRPLHARTPRVELAD